MLIAARDHTIHENAMADRPIYNSQSHGVDYFRLLFIFKFMQIN